MITYALRSQLGNIKPAQVPAHFDDVDVFHPDTHKALILRACRDVMSDYAHRVMWCLNYEDWDKLLDMDVSPHDYSDATSYYKDAQISALIRKYPKWQTSHDPELQAKKTFIACEVRCRETNQRFWSGGTIPPAVSCVLAIAQRNISNILRDVPDIQDLKFRFGPGASYSVKYNTSALDKLASPIDATPACYAIKDLFLESCPGWRPNHEFDLVGPLRPPVVIPVKGDRLAFVPKTAKTHRPIGINPLLNGVIQKGYGAVIRSRLKRYLDLNDLQPIHRVKARNASRGGDLVTIDLKAASDTIAYALVQELLPDPWFQALHNVRSPQYFIEDNWYTYQKFSAMGNGFTFELETLIFFALCSAVCESMGVPRDTVSVYGDDIICPRQCVPLLEQTLAVCGFEINEEKSFIFGPFRESCGGDYFSGQDVRPFFLKDSVTYRTLFLMRNYFERTGHRYLFPGLFRLLSKLLGDEVIMFYRANSPLDDGCLLDTSIPFGSYNGIVAYEKGKRRSHKVRAYGVSHLLYRVYCQSEPSSEGAVAWYKTRNYKVKYRLYRHVHL